MPTERIAMHRIKELLRLRYECALSFERIALALKISKGVVAMPGVNYLELRSR